MAKKGLVVLALAAFVAGGAFAAPSFKLSLGLGGYFTSDFGGGFEASGQGWKETEQNPYAGGGGFVFFDVYYAELSVGFFGGGGTSTWEYIKKGEAEISYTGLDLNLLFKYPIGNNKVSGFPLVGIGYRIMLSSKDKDGDPIYNVYEEADVPPGDLSALWFKFGGGLDFGFTTKIFLRGEILYGIRLPNKYENSILDVYSNSNNVTNSAYLLGHGPDIKLALVYKL
jgi:hypothetical protein